MSDEPVAYLGGQAAPSPDDDPYGAAKEEEVDGYLGGSGGSASPAEDEVDGYLGGSGGAEEELPALPAAESKAGYSAHDFLDHEAEPEPEPEYGDPYGAPADTGYEGYGDASTAVADDASYFDGMGHEDTSAAPSSVDAYADDYGTDDQPKTISQQDAESIIRRITTKKILPTDEGENRVAVAPPPKLTEAGSGVRVWPFVAMVLIALAAVVWGFDKEIDGMFPGLLPWVEQEVKPEVEVIAPSDPPEVIAKRNLLKMVLQSELKAFKLTEGEIRPELPDKPVQVGEPGPGAGAPGGGQ